ncbi:MAG: serine hydrolase domain-containing protein [Candidatus Dormibacterales bacterium]
MEGGFSKPRLGRVREVLEGQVDRGGIPGLVALVSRRGEVHVEAVGVRSIGGDAIAQDAIFRIASMTKPVTAVATMILIEEGRLRLDEPVDRLLPELAGRRVLKEVDATLDQTVPANRPITVRDLLTFTAGFGYLFTETLYPIHLATAEQGLSAGPPRPEALPTPDEYMRRLGTLPLMYQPGEVWLYNTGAEILSVLVARASGQPFDEFLSEHIFEPLGMKDTGFVVPAGKLDRLTTCYATNRQSGEVGVFDAAETSEWRRAPAFQNGAGGLVSTAGDFLAFAQMLLNHGSNGRLRVLSRPSVELMTTDQLTAKQKSVSGLQPGMFADHGWGFCLYIVTGRTGFPSVGSYGWGGGLGTAWETDPREEMITILLTTKTWDSSTPPPVFGDYWTSIYAAFDD